MKSEIRIAAGRQYEYTSHFLEGSFEENLEEERKIRRAYEEKDGLSEKDFNSFIDKQIQRENLEIEVWEQMNEYQKGVVGIIKRSLKRIGK